MNTQSVNNESCKPTVLEAKKHVKIVLKQVPVSQIDTAEFNPSSRTEVRALSGLMDNIRERGVLAPLHVIQTSFDPKNPRYVLVDGHRRFAVCCQLGEYAVPCVVHKDTSPAALWADLSRDTRALSAFEWMVAWSETGTEMEKRIPKAHMSKIRQCLEIFGTRKKLKEAMIDQRVAPSLCQPVNFLYEAFVTLGPPYSGVKREIIARWIIDHRLQLSLKALQRHKWTTGTHKKLYVRMLAGKTFSLADILAH